MIEYPILVNKSNPLNRDYIPKDLVIVKIPFYGNIADKEKTMLRKDAAKAMKALYKAIKKAGLKIVGVSAYRSFARQQLIFNTSVMDKGLEATREVIAPAGCSEHQTGLAIDVTSPSCDYKLDSSFAKTSEYLWLSKYCYMYGFIIRYPRSTKHLTGYDFEPWHLRYVGIETATYMKTKNLTLEEIYSLH